ncbi:MAG: hypothetical protein JWN34_5378 [Bryobacterales bacterium]|nr:hypothetical protein [Bryobacterales bacterium]
MKPIRSAQNFPLSSEKRKHGGRLCLRLTGDLFAVPRFPLTASTHQVFCRTSVLQKRIGLRRAAPAFHRAYQLLRYAQISVAILCSQLRESCRKLLR